MNRFALVRHGVVQSIIVTDKEASEFPDIASSLVPCEDSVLCNFSYDGTNFTAPVIEVADVTPRQIRQALILSGVSMQSIEDALDTLSEPTKSLAKAEWEYSISFQRSRPLVAQVGAMLGWNSAQLDALWALASTL